MLVKTSLTQSTKPINNVNVDQNIYSKKMNNERPENGTSWYSFMTNTGFEAFYFTRGREKREKGREAGGKGTGGGRFRPPCPPPLQTNISGILSRTSQTQTRATADASTSKTPDEFFPASCNKWRPAYDFRQRTYYLANYSNWGVHH